MDNKIKSGVYMILNIQTNERYIGSTPRSINIRWSEHRSTLRRNKNGNPNLQEAWNKYGEDNFAFIILERTIDTICREQYWIDKFKDSGFVLYNRCPNAANHAGLVMPVQPMINGAAKGQETRAHWSEERRIEFIEKCRSHWTPEAKEEFSKKIKSQWENNRAKMHHKFDLPYRFCSPEGKAYDVFHLSNFCKEHKLDPSAMLKIYKGGYGRKSYKGWTKDYTPT